MQPRRIVEVERALPSFKIADAVTSCDRAPHQHVGRRRFRWRSARAVAGRTSERQWDAPRLTPTACASTSGCSAVRSAAADIAEADGPVCLPRGCSVARRAAATTWYPAPEALTFTPRPRRRLTSQKSAAKMQKAARHVGPRWLTIALAEDADVDGSFEDGSGSGEPERRAVVVPLAAAACGHAIMPPPFMPPAAASGLVRRSPPSLPLHSQTPLTARPFARAIDRRGRRHGGRHPGRRHPSCDLRLLRPRIVRQEGGGRQPGVGAASVWPGGPRPQAGPMTDQGQELVVKTSSPAAGI